MRNQLISIDTIHAILDAMTEEEHMAAFIEAMVNARVGVNTEDAQFFSERQGIAYPYFSTDKN